MVCTGNRYGRTHKITAGSCGHFPAPPPEAHIANKGDIGNSVSFRAFFLVQNRTKTAQNCAILCKNVQKHDRKDEIFATGFIKGCQVVWRVSIRKYSIVSRQ
jgi:hypothetical protein